MKLNNLLSLNFILNNYDVGSKKRTLDHISALISDSVEGLTHDTVFTGLIEREKLGSTGIGDGVAIPHCRLDDIEEARAICIKLLAPIDFDAIDKAPVDLVFALVVPSHSTEEHLQTLAELAELFSSEDNREALRNCHNNEALFNTLKELTQ